MIQKIIRRFVPHRLKLKLKYLIRISRKEELKKYKNIKKIIYCLVPSHGNLGDQAIAYATRRFFNDNFKEYKVLEFERDEIYIYERLIKSILNKDDLIVLHGGGNMGNIYIQEEEPRRFIISKFKNNKIISMTQTIMFTDDSKGNKEKEKTVKLYNKNHNLILLAREDRSYQIMRQLFIDCKVTEILDIVFYLEDLFKVNKNRKYIMTCLRKDKESYFRERVDGLLQKLKKDYSNVVESDTIVNKAVNKSTRERELFKIWDDFRNAKVVITDRLHGMIFATITKTPCIVLRSLDHKIIESYKWVKDLNYIRFVEEIDVNNIKLIIEELSALKDLDKTSFKEKYFSKLKNQLGIQVNK